jgi:hypothetical protein
VLNLTSADSTKKGFATIYPCDASRPNASNLNFIPGQTAAVAVVAKLSAAGTVCLYSHTPSHYVIDVSGVIPTATYAALPAPRRLLETRSTGTTFDGQYQNIGARGAGASTQLRVAGRAGIPANASSVILNVTATQGASPGFVTVYPKGVTRPNASNVNFPPGQSVANLVVANIGDGGNVCLYTHKPTHLVVDVAGYFTGPASATTGNNCSSTPPPNCDPSYPTVCIPPPPPDLNCGDIPHRRFTVLPPDPHNFDGNNDGIGCES